MLDFLRTEAINFIKEKTKYELVKPISIEILQIAIDFSNMFIKPTILFGFGVLIGDYFIKKYKMKWLAVEDEFERDIAIFAQNNLYKICAPILISTRIQNNEKVDVIKLISKLEKHMKVNIKKYKNFN